MQHSAIIHAVGVVTELVTGAGGGVVTKFALNSSRTAGDRQQKHRAVSGKQQKASGGAQPVLRLLTAVNTYLSCGFVPLGSACR